MQLDKSSESEADTRWAGHPVMGWPTAHSLTHQRPMHWTADLQRWAAEPVRLLARWRSGEKLDEAIDAAAESRLPDCDATIEWGVGVAVAKGPLGAQIARTWP